ncbi:MAG: 50S ribosomal protein L32e [Desulfurococcales archaeon]|nr:50S ribosomal protein L32e [Desulfurococcales archaeon]MCE4622124.1 50S ribosomal protein L32e [Desulfurococcales archaeon]MCE4626336.1 50S ribosomal protein L32e [Desulfurococcales archaeon]MCE4629211.1 50S ribosomal protein L32e [Desulfurococcales archaeon]
MSKEEVVARLKEKRKLQRKLAKRREKPVFRRYLSWRFWKFERREYWRKPKGNDSKMRLQLKGYPPIVKVGYGTPAELRGLHPSGLVPVRVSSVRDLEGLDPEKHIVVIASTVGLRKRLALVGEARARGFKVANG